MNSSGIIQDICNDTPNLTKSVVKGSVYVSLKDYRDNISKFADSALGLSLWDEQKSYLTNFDTKYNIISAGQGWGKKETVAIRSLWYGFYLKRPIIERVTQSNNILRLGYKILIISPSKAQSNMQIFDNIVNLCTYSRSKLNPYIMGVTSKAYPILTMRSIYRLPIEIHSRTIESISIAKQEHQYDYVIIHLAAYIPKLINKIMPIISELTRKRSGLVDIISHPKREDPHNDFYKIHQMGMNDNNGIYKSVFGNSKNNPFSQTKNAKSIPGYPDYMLFGGRFSE